MFIFGNAICRGILNNFFRLNCFSGGVQRHRLSDLCSYNPSTGYRVTARRVSVFNELILVYIYIYAVRRGRFFFLMDFSRETGIRVRHGF